LADQFTRMLAQRIGVDYEALRARLLELRRAARRREPSVARQAAAQAAAPGRVRDWLTLEEYLLHLIWRHPDHGRLLLPHLAPDDFYRADARALFELTQTAHLQPMGGGSDDGDGRTVVASLPALPAVDGPLGDHAAWIREWG